MVSDDMQTASQVLAACITVSRGFRRSTNDTSDKHAPTSRLQETLIAVMHVLPVLSSTSTP